MLKYVHSLLIIALTPFLFSSAGYSEDLPLYIGLGYNSSQADGLDQPYALNGSVVSEDLNSTGIKLFVGTKVSNYFSVELGYADLGSVRKERFRPTASGSIPAGTTVQNQSATMTYLTIIGFLPLRSSLSLLAELGIHSTKLDLTSSGTTVANPVAEGLKDTSESQSGAILGIGLEYKVSDSLSAKLVFDRYRTINYGTKSLSIAYSF